MIDFTPGGRVPNGFTVVKRIYKKRSIQVLMEKFRAAVEVAKFIGMMKKGLNKDGKQMSK